MKKHVLYHIAVSVLFLFFGSLTAWAHPEYLMTIQVPFDFQVNEKLLQAGKYEIKRDPQNPRILMIQCLERKIWVTVHTIPHSLSKEPARTSLIFTEYGAKRFLSEVKVLGREDGFALIKSKSERRLAQTAEAKAIRCGGAPARPVARAGVSIISIKGLCSANRVPGSRVNGRLDSEHG